MIFEIENHRISSYYDLHIKNFNSDELKFLIEYQYDIQNIYPIHPICSRDTWDGWGWQKRPSPFLETVHLLIP